MWSTFIECLLRVKQCQKNFLFINSFSPHNNLSRQMLFLVLFLDEKTKAESGQIACLTCVSYPMTYELMAYRMWTSLRKVSYEGSLFYCCYLYLSLTTRKQTKLAFHSRLDYSQIACDVMDMLYIPGKGEVAQCNAVLIVLQRGESGDWKDFFSVLKEMMINV